MKLEIIRKLEVELAKVERLDEPLAVYFCVQIRKLLDRENLLRDYPATNFNCSWAVHARMSRGEETDRILRILDNVFPQLANKPIDQLPIDVAAQFKEIVGFERFRDELEKILIQNGLPLDIVKKEWPRFLSLFGAIVEDIPLSIKDERAPLTNIQYVTVHRDNPTSISHKTGEHKLFRIRWVSHGKNGKIGEAYSINSFQV